MSTNDPTPADVSSQANVVTFTDQTKMITSIRYVDQSLVISAGQPSTPPATVTQIGNTFTITMNAGRSKTNQVADLFNSVCGGQNFEYAPQGGGGTPGQLNFFFEVVIEFDVEGTLGSITAYLGQGSYGSFIDPTNNWWIGGSNINSAQPQLVFEVSGQIVTIPLSGTQDSFTLSQAHLQPAGVIKNVFVLMLENHSFDNMFALSGISGIRAATTDNSNSYGGTPYNVHSPAPASMVSDPGHEFTDVVAQLCGPGQTYPSGGPYPPINNSGFAANFATSTTEGPPSPPPAGNIGDIMACFATPSELPIIYQLATQFTLCDQWFSSLPGPTWPNRYFVHGASSAGLDHSPSTKQMAEWESIFSKGFIYPHGSIYDALTAANISYGLFIDTSGSTVGGIPQVSSIHNIHYLDVSSLDDFVAALQSSNPTPYPYQYTFIEPNYGDITNGSYEGGSSQHPMDGVANGEQLIQTVYEAIRNSNVWGNSLLIITYDEHGGFYDSYAPPSAPQPNDNSPTTLNQFGFNFEQLGVRVPAVIVSPWVAAGVDHTVYDHSSVLATVEEIFGLKQLTERDGDANNLLQLITDTLRTDCPTSLGRPAAVAARPPITAAQQMILDQQPLLAGGNLAGFLAIMAKTELELSAGTPAEHAAIVAKVQAIKTRGEARAYITSVQTKASAAASIRGRRR
jgi:phospholipase C